MRNDKLVIVLSRNYSNGLAVVRSLGAAGYTVDLIANAYKEGAMDIAACSKYLNKVTEVVSEKIKQGDEGDDPALMEAIMGYAGESESKPLLFPTDDYTATVIDTHRDALSEFFLMPGLTDGKQGDLVALMDKTAQLAMASEVGLLTPYTTTVSLRSEDIVIPEDVIYPCYVKPLRSIQGFKTEMAVCYDEDELREHLGIMRARHADRDVIIQEFLDIDQEYASAGVCLDQEVILPALIRKSRIGQHGRGVTLTGELVSVDEIGKENAEKAIELLKRFRYTGNFGMEFNRVGDKLYFNEVNLRSAGEGYSYFRTGANLPAIFADMAFEGSYDPELLKFEGIGKTLMYDKIAWEDYVYGFITREELDKCIEETDVKVLVDEDDPEPGAMFVDELQKQHDRHDRRMQRRLECIMASAIEKGWEREEAEQALDDARERLGISYADYKKYKFWKINPVDQFDRYDEIKERRIAREKRGTKKKPVVVVLARRNGSGLTAVRSFGEAGYTVDLVGIERLNGGSTVMGASKYIRVHAGVQSALPEDAKDVDVINELREYRKRGKRKLILFPADDYAVRVMDANRKSLRSTFKMPSVVEGDEGTLVELMDRSVQRELAEAAGLDLRNRWIIDLSQDQVSIPEGVSYPCRCEPSEERITIYKEARTFEEAEELNEHLQRLKERDPEREAIITEIPEEDCSIQIVGLSDDQEMILPGVIKLQRVDDSDEGNTSEGVFLPFSDFRDDLKDSITRFMQQLHYRGVFCISFDIAGDKYYFRGVRFHGGGMNAAVLKSGVNLPALMLKNLQKLPHEPEEEEIQAFGKRIVNERLLRRDAENGVISRAVCDEKIRTADITIYGDKKDTEPANLFYERLGEAEAKRSEERSKQKKRKLKRDVKSSVKKAAKAVGGDALLAVRGYPQGLRKNRRDPNSEYPRVLVAGRNWGSNLCMAKSVGEAGYEVEVLHVFPRKPGKRNIQRWLRPEKYSKFVKAYYALNAKRNDKRIVKRLLKIADPDRKMLIIPADDLVASTIDEYYYDLKDYYIMPTVDGKGGEICRLMSKQVQKELAKEAGLPVLNSCVISSEGAGIEIPDTVTYPCFIKPNISKNGLKTKMMKCESEAELRAVLESRKAEGFEMLVEDFADIKRELSYLGLSTVDGVVCPGYFEAVIEGEGSHRGVALLGRLLPAEDAEPLMSEVVKFIESLKYNGLFDVDLIETKDGKVYFVELNMRYGGSGFAVTRAGVNLPGMYCDYILKGKPIDKTVTLGKAGQTFVSEKVLIDEFKDGLIEYEDIENIVSQADICFTMDDADLKPYEHLKKHYETARQLRQINEERALEKQAKKEQAEKEQKEALELKMEERRRAAEEAEKDE